ncbi:MAG: hypothetical protein V1885_00075 [Candidatus Brennerbacteria bacterium]
MLAILVALICIGIITALTWLVNEKNLLPIKVCAICAGTAGTWILLLAGILFGWLTFASYMPVVAILMGGSVVGIAYQGERYLKAGRSALLWKALFIPLGFVTAWSVTNFALGFAILGVLVLLTVAGFFLELPLAKGDAARAERLEERMKDCC